MSQPLRMAVIGAGHFGAFHAAKVAASPRATLVAVVDTDAAKAAAIAGRHGAAAETDYRAVLDRIDAVSVAVPTRAHAEVAGAFLRAGKHVLVEKPIAGDLAAARDLIGLAETSGAVLQVGHLARFYGVVEALRGEIGRPLFIDAVRIAPFKPRGTDVSVILDLMVHDIDLILSLVDAPLRTVDAAGAPVISDSEDIANARLTFANGCVATITASRISLKTERKMRIFQNDAYFAVDFDARRIRVIRRGAVGRELMPGVPDIDIREKVYEETDALGREIDAFVAAALDGTPPVVSGQDGLRALETALRVTDALRAHAAIVAAADAADR